MTLHQPPGSMARTRLSPFRPALRAALHDDSRVTTYSPHTNTHCCNDRLRPGFNIGTVIYQHPSSALMKAFVWTPQTQAGRSLIRRLVICQR
jgi:hypothetical protein